MNKSKASIKKWVEVIYGKDGIHTVPYLTRIRLLNSNPKRLLFKNGLFIHKFHRGDWDRAFHDHPWDFWTFPLQTYYEDVLSENGNIIKSNKVASFTWHFRDANYAHMVRTDQKFPIWTLVLPGVKMPVTWGFYVTQEYLNKIDQGYIPEKPNRGKLIWIPWKKYVFDDHLSRMNKSQEEYLICKHCGNEIHQYVDKECTGHVTFRCSNCGLESTVHQSQLNSPVIFPNNPNDLIIDLTLENWWL